MNEDSRQETRQRICSERFEVTGVLISLFVPFLESRVAHCVFFAVFPSVNPCVFISTSASGAAKRSRAVLLHNCFFRGGT